MRFLRYTCETCGPLAYGHGRNRELFFNNNGGCATWVLSVPVLGGLVYLSANVRNTYFQLNAIRIGIN